MKIFQNTANKKTIVFILSTNYAGSHYLSLLLGSNSKAEHLGEMKHMMKNSGECFVCGESCQCRLFNGIDTLSTEEIYPTLFSRISPEKKLLVDNSKKIKWAKPFLDTPQYQLKYIHLIRDPRALARRWMISYPKFEDILNQKIKSIRSYPRKFLPIFLGSQIYAYIYKWLHLNEQITEFLSSHN